LLILLATLAVLTFIGACVGGGHDHSRRCGAIDRQSGHTGRYYVTLSVTVDAINEKGGVKVGDKAYKLALKLYDNQSDVNLSVRQYVQLVTSDKANFLLGPFAAILLSTTAPSQRNTRYDGSGRRRLRAIYSRGYKFIFGTCRRPATTMRAPSRCSTSSIRSQLRSRSLPPTTASTCQCGGTRAHLKQAGLDLAVDQKFADATASFPRSLGRQVEEPGRDPVDRA